MAQSIIEIAPNPKGLKLLGNCKYGSADFGLKKKEKKKKRQTKKKVHSVVCALTYGGYIYKE